VTIDQLMKRALLVLMTIGSAAFTPVRAAEMLAPDALAKSVTDDVLVVLRSDKDIQSGNTKKVVDLVENKVLPHFDFVRMTQLALGRNWREAAPEQKKLLVAEFRGLLVQTYAATFTAYKDQVIEYRPLRYQPSDTEVVVRSQIQQPGGRPITVDYRMHRLDAGWKVFDVVVGDLSLVQNYRGSFETEVRKGGIDGLIKTLADKNRQLSSMQAAADKK
jgi:phospholipid transport system substrate-binding protein